MVRSLSIIVLLSWLSCKPVRGTLNTIPHETLCNPAQFRGIKEYPTSITPSDILRDSGLSESSVLVAEAFGFSGEIELLISSRAAFLNDSSSVNQIQLLASLEQLNESMALAVLETETFADLVECRVSELERIKQNLDNENAKIDRKLTSAAVITAGIASITIGLVLVTDDPKLQEGNLFDWIGVISGLTATYLAVRSTRVDQKILIAHPTNLIRNIVEGENSDEAFPIPVWHLMNEGNPSTRSRIIYSWEETDKNLYSLDSGIYNDLINGDGGEYSSKMLDVRIKFFSQIESATEELLLAFLTLRKELKQF